jgi:hypothetical protein
MFSAADAASRAARRCRGKEVTMRKLMILATLAAAACTMTEPSEADRSAHEAALSKALAGYEADGPQVDCVDMLQLGGNKSAGEAIVFEGKTRTRLWVNHPPGGCPDLNLGRALQTRASQTRLCRGDYHPYRRARG